MIDILNRFLIQNKSISIPGLGTIHAERVPAKVDAADGRIIPPHFQFRFDKYFDAPDRNFFTYLSMQRQIPDFEAIRLYNQFAQDFRSGIRMDEKSAWENIGYFQKNHSGEIEFFQTADRNSEYHAVALPAVNSAVPEADSETVIAEPESSLLVEPAFSGPESSLLVEPAIAEAQSSELVEAAIAESRASPLVDEAIAEPEPSLPVNASITEPQLSPLVDAAIGAPEPSLLEEPAFDEREPRPYAEPADAEPLPLAETPFANPVEETYQPVIRNRRDPEKLRMVIGLVLLVIGLIIAGLHFGKFGSNWRAAANQQSLRVLPH